MQHRIAPRGALLAALLAATFGIAACSESEAPDCGGLKVNDAWVRVAPAGADVMGAYFSLANEGATKVVVSQVSSSQFDRAEMHETVVNDDGQASMQPLEQIVVPAGETVDFKPGGRHLMLFGPTQPYAAGDQVELILACGTQNAELPVAATVRAEQPGAANQGEMARESGQDMDHDRHEAQPTGAAGDDTHAADEDPGAGASEDAATADP